METFWANLKHSLKTACSSSVVTSSIMSSYIRLQRRIYASIDQGNQLLNGPLDHTSQHQPNTDKVEVILLQNTSNLRQPWSYQLSRILRPLLTKKASIVIWCYLDTHKFFPRPYVQYSYRRDVGHEGLQSNETMSTHQIRCVSKVDKTIWTTLYGCFVALVCILIRWLELCKLTVQCQCVSWVSKYSRIAALHYTACHDATNNINTVRLKLFSLKNWAKSDVQGSTVSEYRFFLLLVDVINCQALVILLLNITCTSLQKSSDEKSDRE